jgi:hypothetical protein
MSDLTPSERELADTFEGVTAPSGVDQWRERPARSFRPARSWAAPLAGVVAVALIAGGLGAYFGIRASVGGPAGSNGATPPPRAGGAMAFDSNTGSMVLFGGTGSSGPLHDTWTWDGSSWTQQHPAHNPPATAIGPMAYDPASHDMVLVTVSVPNGSGSISSGDPATVNPPRAQTWLWDGADWHTASGVQPPVSALTRLATDTAAGDVVLVATGGAPRPLLGAPCRVQVPTSDPIPTICNGYLPVRTATWVWNGTSWKDPGAAGPLQSSSSNFDAGAGSLVTDPATGHAEYIASTPGIVPLCVTPGLPPPSPSLSPPHFLPPPPANGAAGSGTLLTPPAVVSGKPVPAPSEPPLPTLPCAGVQSGGSALPAFVPRMVISRWTGSAWSAPQDVTGPKGKAFTGGSLVASAGAHGLVFYNLADGSVSTYTGTWTTTTAAVHPPASAGAVAMAYDSVRGQLVIFGGAVISSPPVLALSSETWTWDGSTWLQHGGTLQPQMPISVTGKPGIALPGGTSVAPAAPATPR